MDFSSQDNVKMILDSPYAEEFKSKYIIDKKLGEGTSGQVYAGQNRKNKHLVAMKFVLIKDATVTVDSDSGKSTPEEVATMLLIRHIPGCVKLVDHFRIDTFFVIVTERVTCELNLGDYARELKVTSLTETKTYQILKQLLETVIKLYNAGLFHGDLSRKNILINIQTGDVKLIDFGSAFRVQSELDLDVDGVSFSVWQLGVTLCGLVNAKVAHAMKDGTVAAGQYSFGDHLSEELKDLMGRMVGKRGERPSFQQILQHPWMQKQAQTIGEDVQNL